MRGGSRQGSIYAPRYMGKDPLPPGVGVLPSESNVARWLGQALEVRRETQGVAQSPLLSIPECPPMCPEPGFIEFISIKCHSLWPLLLSHHPEEFTLLFLHPFLIEDPFPRGRPAVAALHHRSNTRPEAVVLMGHGVSEPFLGLAPSLGEVRASLEVMVSLVLPLQVD
jgi:hypothetical protein